jgi:hypothetical protein
MCRERRAAKLFGVEPPRPRIEALRIVDMSSSNAWAEFAAIFSRTRLAYLEHEQAKSELKSLVHIPIHEPSTDRLPHTSLPREAPRLCRGGSNSLTALRRPGALDGVGLHLGEQLLVHALGGARTRARAAPSSWPARRNARARAQPAWGRRPSLP